MCSAGWTQIGQNLTVEPKATLPADNRMALSRNGKVVALGGNERILGPNGYVQVFELSVQNVWVPKGQRLSGEEFRKNWIVHLTALNANGSVLAISTRERISDRPYNNTKYVVTQVFHYSQENNTWFQVGSSMQGSDMGISISLSDPGDVLAVSESSGIISNGPGNGTTTVYHWNQNGQDWSPLGSSLVGQNKSNFFGWSIDLSADGSRIVVGAPWYSHDRSEAVGLCQVYQYNKTDSAWGQLGQDLIGGKFDHLGGAVSISYGKSSCCNQSDF